MGGGRPDGRLSHAVPRRLRLALLALQVSAGVGSAFATTVFHPVHIVKTLMQAQLKDGKHANTDDLHVATTVHCCTVSPPHSSCCTR